VGPYDLEATSGTDTPVVLGEGGQVRVHFPPDRLWLLPADEMGNGR